jgi:hypothetical protein
MTSCNNNNHDVKILGTVVAIEDQYGDCFYLTEHSVCSLDKSNCLNASGKWIHPQDGMEFIKCQTSVATYYVATDDVSTAWSIANRADNRKAASETMFFVLFLIAATAIAFWMILS